MNDLEDMVLLVDEVTPRLRGFVKTILSDECQFDAKPITIGRLRLLSTRDEAFCLAISAVHNADNAESLLE